MQDVKFVQANAICNHNSVYLKAGLEVVVSVYAELLHVAALQFAERLAGCWVAEWEWEGLRWL